MLQISQVRGAIFDVDDTLLDNYPPHIPEGLHEASRLRAAYEVGRHHGSQGLMAMTIEQSIQAFRDAKVHTLHAAIWQMLLMAGEVSDAEPQYDHPLLVEIAELKEVQHEAVLRSEGKELPGASAFVRALAARPQLAGRLAVASTACRRDIDVFFAMTGLNSVFPDDRIISRERFTHAKPHPEPFNLAFERLGLPESARPNTLAFEDDPRGIMSAKAAGLYTIAITSRYPREELEKLTVAPDFIASSYAEIADAIGLPTQ
jgi:mannitol-1-/sugar-/sorbitol-6-phosphatase